MGNEVVLEKTLLSQKFCGMLSIAMKAGRLEVGEARVTEATRSGRTHLVILAADASENTKKKFKNMTDFRSLPLIVAETKESLGRIVGREFAVVIAVADKGFADGLIGLVNNFSD